MINNAPNNQTKEKTMKSNYCFERVIKKESEKEKEIVLSFNIILYEEEILFQAKEIKDNLKSESALYKKNYLLNELKDMSSYFFILKNLDKIYASLKNNFEKNKDIISLEKDKVIIKFTINFDIIEEEIILNLPVIEKSESEEMSNIKETVIFLDEEKKNLKAEIAILKKNENNLNTTVEKLKEELSSVRKEFKEMSKYVKNMLRPDEEEEKEIQKCEFIREKAFNQKEEENMIKEKNTPNEKYISPNVFMIYIYLYEDKIKIRINEIQDNLKSNPLIYENTFYMNDFEKVSKYYIKYTDIKAIYDFLCDLFKNKKDVLDKIDDTKVVLNLTFPCGLKEDNINLEILNKELSLNTNLKNIKESIKIINKNMKNNNNQNNDLYKEMKTDIDDLKKQTYRLKIEFQKDLLEKVYPVGSYYWSQNNTSPEELFGGKWETISGRFLFSTDSNHSVNTTGGEEMHSLTINEMPSHSHQYYCINSNYFGTQNCDYTYGNRIEFLYKWLSDDKGYKTGTEQTGGNQPHNNMPPYLTAYCWRRYK